MSSSTRTSLSLRRSSAPLERLSPIASAKDWILSKSLVRRFKRRRAASRSDVQTQASAQRSFRLLRSCCGRAHSPEVEPPPRSPEGSSDTRRATPRQTGRAQEHDVGRNVLLDRGPKQSTFKDVTTSSSRANPRPDECIEKSTQSFVRIRGELTRKACFLERNASYIRWIILQPWPSLAPDNGRLQDIVELAAFDRDPSGR